MRLATLVTKKIKKKLALAVFPVLHNMIERCYLNQGGCYCVLCCQDIVAIATKPTHKVVVHLLINRRNENALHCQTFLLKHTQHTANTFSAPYCEHKLMLLAKWPPLLSLCITDESC